jgi:hypothetical protein
VELLAMAMLPLELLLLPQLGLMPLCQMLPRQRSTLVQLLLL